MFRRNRRLISSPPTASDNAPPSPLAQALQQIDADALSPREALDLIYQLKQIQARSDAD